MFGYIKKPKNSETFISYMYEVSDFMASLPKEDYKHYQNLLKISIGFHMPTIKPMKVRVQKVSSTKKKTKKTTKSTPKKRATTTKK